MGNELITRAERPIATQEGALALRQTMCSAASHWIDDDPEQARRLLGPALAEMLPSALVEARAWLAPATRGDFKATVAPTLALVAPAGMSTGDQTAWLATAAETLSGIPADLLEMGCREARKTVDHPSKIVPAIFKIVQHTWDRRRAELARVNRMVELSHQPMPEEPARLTAGEAAAIIEEAGLRIRAPAKPARPSGPPRKPSPADLAAVAKEIGIDPNSRDDRPVADIAGLSIAEIFRQRDYAIARDIDAAQPLC